MAASIDEQVLSTFAISAISLTNDSNLMLWDQKEWVTTIICILLGNMYVKLGVLYYQSVSDNEGKCNAGYSMWNNKQRLGRVLTPLSQ